MIVQAEALRALVAAVFEKVPIPEEHARLVAELLVDTDLRGVVSHGVLQVDRYVRSYQQRQTNPAPRISLLHEGPVTAALSGDGGLGMIAATRAMQLAMAKAKALGVGAATTTYHAHIGSAGKYVRMALRRGLIGMVSSGRSAAAHYHPDSPVRGSIQGDPPLALGAPSGPGQPYLLLDMGTHIPWDEEVFGKLPQIYFKSLGLSHLANVLSGTLGGQMLPPFDRERIEYPDANQSGFFLAIDVGRFVPQQAFTDDVDRLMAGVRQMQPFPGGGQALLPGGPEWEREQRYAREGVPINAAAVKYLEQLAGEFGLQVPW